MKNRSIFSRKEFLARAGALTMAGSLSSLGMSELFASPKARKKIGANEKVNIAAIGIGNRAAEIIKELDGTGLCQFVALCDTDMGADHTIGILKRFPKLPKFQDFRKMFDKMGSDIDAVCIGTPDFSHFPATMMAMSLGIHVYVEKPMAHTFQECQLMMDAEKKYNVVTQMGNQGHSGANYFQFKAWVDAGIIKDVTAINAHMNNARRWHKWDPNMKSFPSGEPIPSTLDWDLWLGTEQFKDFNKDYVNGQWRCWYDLGMGALGDWGAHILDTAHQFLELGLPTEVNMLYANGHNPFFYPFSSTIEFKFPERGDKPACDVTWYDGLDNIPKVPEGMAVETDSNIPLVAGQKLQPTKLAPGKEIYSKNLTFAGASHSSTLSIIDSDYAREIESKLPEVPESPSNHFENFLLSCKGDEQTRSPFSIAGPLSQVFCLGTIAQRLNAKLSFDPKKQKFTNNKLATELLKGPAPRKGWEEFYKL